MRGTLSQVVDELFCEVRQQDSLFTEGKSVTNNHPANKNFTRGSVKKMQNAPCLLGASPKGKGIQSYHTDNSNANTQSPEPGVIRAMQTPGNSRSKDLGAREAVLQRLL